MTAKKHTIFDPVFSITPAIAANLMRIEAVRQAIQSLPITPRVLASLRETARLFSTHYSTMIEGNRLTQGQVVQVIGEEQHFPGRERDEGEVKGYYAALDEVERAAQQQEAVTEATVQRLHALVMGGGKTRVRPTPYRDGQNVIRDSRSSGIVYMPPEAKDVPPLMNQLVAWLSRHDELPVPIRAGVAHYQFATIHPYYDGNGRTARLLTTLILHLGRYDLKGLYALEEYYARGLKGYYEALTVGPSHNYYMGRAEGGHAAKWISYYHRGHGGLVRGRCATRPRANTPKAARTKQSCCGISTLDRRRRLRSSGAHARSGPRRSVRSLGPSRAPRLSCVNAG